MTATVDIANVASSPLTGGSNPYFSFAATCGATDNFLVVIETSAAASASQVPTSVTYNSVGLTLLGSSSSQVTGPAFFSTSIWYLANPPTGAAHTVAVNYGATPGLQLGGVTAIPMSGVNTSAPFGTPALAHSAANNIAAVTATGAGSADVYLAAAINGIATMIATGTNQTNLSAINGQGGGANASTTADTIPGTSAGAFTWGPSGTQWGNGWAAVGVAVFALPPPSILLLGQILM